MLVNSRDKGASSQNVVVGRGWWWWPTCSCRLPLCSKYPSDMDKSFSVSVCDIQHASNALENLAECAHFMRLSTDSPIPSGRGEVHQQGDSLVHRRLLWGICKEGIAGVLRNQECTGSEDGRFFIVQKEADRTIQGLSGFSWFDQLEGVVSNILATLGKWNVGVAMLLFEAFSMTLTLNRPSIANGRNTPICFSIECIVQCLLLF